MLILFAPLIAAFFGLLYEGIDRKLTARMHNRIGPPILQPLYDFLKLLCKENLIPEGAVPFYFNIFPILALASSLIVLYLLPISPLFSFGGDVLVLLYFLLLIVLFTSLAGFVSANPFSTVGAIRKIMLLIAYELPFLVVILAVCISSGTLTMTEITPTRFLPFAFLAYLLTLQATLMRAPFHIPDAETEIVAGIYTEFSGFNLAILKLTNAIYFYIMISLGVILFLNYTAVTFYLYSFLFLFVSILLKVITARLRIDQSFRFFWFLLTPLALIDLVRVLL